MDFMRIDFSSVPMPVALRFDAPMTDEELMAFSERNQPWRFERESNGEITVMTPVGGDGGEQELYVASTLFNWVRTTGRGKVFGSNTGFNLADGSCLAPDAAWLPYESYRALTPAERRGYPPLCPPFVVEVRSPSDSRRVLEEKMQRWIENGAQLAWLIDPIEKQVVVYRPGEATETLESPDIVRGHAPIEGFELDMQPIWNLE